MILSILLAAALPAAASPLTPERAEILLAGVERKAEVEHHPGEALSKALGVPTSAENPYQTVYYARRISKDGVDHTLARAKGIAGWLLTVSDKKGVRYVRVDAKMKPVATAAYRKGDGEPNPMSEKETADFLAAELALWGSAPEQGAPAR